MSTSTTNGLLRYAAKLMLGKAPRNRVVLGRQRPVDPALDAAVLEIDARTTTYPDGPGWPADHVAMSVVVDSTNALEVVNNGAVVYSIDPNGNVQPNSLTAGGATRLLANSVSKTIANGSATALMDVAIANSSFAAGQLFYCVRATDGTDFQCMSGLVTYATVDKAGTKTLAITDLATVDAKAVSTGTLTLAWTNVTGAGKCTLKLQPTTSLTITTTTFDVTYTVFPIYGAVTIL